MLDMDLQSAKIMNECSFIMGMGFCILWQDIIHLKLFLFFVLTCYSQLKGLAAGYFAAAGLLPGSHLSQA